MRERTVDSVDGNDIYIKMKVGKLDLGRWVKKEVLTLAPKSEKK